MIKLFQHIGKSRKENKQEKRPEKEAHSPQKTLTEAKGKRVWQDCWAGRGEHGYRFLDVEAGRTALTIYLTIKDYSDWGGQSQPYCEKTVSMAFPTENRIVTKKYLFACIRTMCMELGETYLMPKTTDDLEWNVFYG